MPELDAQPSCCPRRAAEDLVAAFAAIGDLARPVEAVCAQVSARIGPPCDAADAAVHEAALSVARAIDDQPAFHDRHAYHNRQHFCEVILTADVLCRLDGVTGRHARRVMLAAVVHDIEHDGTSGPAFAYERRSIARSAPFLARAAMDPADVAALAALVAATDYQHGSPVAANVHRWHLGGGVGNAPDVPVAELQALLRDPMLARMAALLCEADVLPSAGLTLAHARRLQARLAREWGRTLHTQDKLHFIDGLMEAGIVGAFFRPNVLAIRRSLTGASRVG